MAGILDNLMQPNPELFDAAAQQRSPMGGLTSLRAWANVQGPQIDMDQVQTRTNQFSDIMSANLPKPRNAKEINKAYQDIMNEYMVNPRSAEEIMAEDQELFGDAEDKHATLQAYLALAKFGAQMANTPGSLLQGLTKPMPELTSDLSKVAAMKQASMTQRAKEARELAREEQRELRGTKMQMAMNALNQSESENNILMQAKMNVSSQALSNAVNTSQWTAEQGAEWAYRAGAQWDKAETVDITLKNQATPTGYAPAKAVVVPTGFGPQTAIQTADGGYRLLSPSEYEPGEYEKWVDVSDPEGGIVKATITRGPREGETIVTQIANPATGETHYTSPYRLEPGRWEPILDEQGNEVKGPDGKPAKQYVGNPMVTEGFTSASNPGNQSPEQRKVLYDRVAAGEEFLTAMDEFLNESNVRSIFGPLASVQRFNANTLGALGADWTENIKRAVNAMDYQVLERMYAQAMAVSDRYAMGDLNWSREQFPDWQTFWQNPDEAVARLHELNRAVLNGYNKSVGELTGEPFARQKRIPQGTEDDPFDYFESSHNEYLRIAKGSRGMDLEGVAVRMSVKEAKSIGAPEWILRGKKPKENIVLKIGQELKLVPTETGDVEFDIADEPARQQEASYYDPRSRPPLPDL